MLSTLSGNNGTSNGSVNGNGNAGNNNGESNGNTNNGNGNGNVNGLENVGNSNGGNNGNCKFISHVLLMIRVIGGEYSSDWLNIVVLKQFSLQRQSKLKRLLLRFT